MVERSGGASKEFAGCKGESLEVEEKKCRDSEVGIVELNACEAGIASVDD